MKKTCLPFFALLLVLITFGCSSDDNNNTYTPTGNVYNLTYQGIATEPGTKIEVHYLYDAPNGSSFAEFTETITSTSADQVLTGGHIVSSRVLTGIYFLVISGGEFRDFKINVRNAANNLPITEINGDDPISTTGDFEDVLLIYNLLEGNGYFEYNPIDFD